MDNILFLGNDYNEISFVEMFLDLWLKIKDLGIQNYFFGIEINYIDRGFIMI